MAATSAKQLGNILATSSVPTTTYDIVNYDNVEVPWLNLRNRSTPTMPRSARAPRKESAFRFLDLPNELRLKVYAFILPRQKRIFLDPQNFYHPLPYVRDDCSDIFNLLQVGRKIHYEASEYLFRNNIVNIIRPKQRQNFLTELGPAACRFITTLECHIHRDLGDIGIVWETMNNCPHLENLRLIFYHDRENWHHLATQIAYHVMFKNDVTLDLELYDSIWARAWRAYDKAALFSLEQAQRQAKVYTFSLPQPIRHVTITASISADVVDHFLDSNQGRDWKLIRTGRQQNGQIRTLRWKGKEIGEDVSLELIPSDDW